MSETTYGLLLLWAAYFIGSIPFGLIAGRLVRGIDIREHGSGNIGATNVGRVLGAKWGVLVLVLDLLKGLLPVAVLAPAMATHLGDAASHWQVGAGVATIAGHMFPCWLGFRGGKGVATALGVALCLAPEGTLVAVVIFATAFGIWRIVSLASILAAIGFAIRQMTLLLPAPFAAPFLARGTWSSLAFSLLVPALIILRHRSNISRLLRGEEPKFRAGDRQ